MLAILIGLWFSIACGARPAPDIRVQGSRPQLIFACELDTEKLQALFSDPDLIPDLKDLHAEVALALQDFSPGRAAVVRQLNAAGVGVIAWMALPRDQGYYLNAGNESAAAARFAEFQKWTADKNLHWAGIGLDIEPSLADWAQLQQKHRVRVLLSLVRRAFSGQRVVRARASYSTLIRQMQVQGYTVQTYQLMFLADERREHSTILERLFGLVDVRGNMEPLMIYSSFNHSLGSGMVWAYGPDAQTVAVGSTAASGDAAMDAKFPPLNWDELSRDLVVASHFSHTVGVYSLEGCVRQGFLPKVKSLDWTRPVVLPAATVAKAQTFRRRVQTILWLASNFVYLAGLLLAAIICLFFWWHKNRIARRALSA